MEVLRIPRCYRYSDVNDPIVHIELHGFSDASKAAYACCLYLKFVTKSSGTKVSFVAAKSRIVPTSKKQSIPRLELLGNLILSQLVFYLSFNKIKC